METIPSTPCNTETSPIESNSHTDAFIVSPSVAWSDKQAIIESLKKEWSTMFKKLETDYQDKLNDQQVQNENRLRELHHEIKQSILIQQQQLLMERSKSETVSMSTARDGKSLFNLIMI